MYLMKIKLHLPLLSLGSLLFIVEDICKEKMQQDLDLSGRWAEECLMELNTENCENCVLGD